MRVLRASGRAALGLDIVPGPFTDEVGVDRRPGLRRALHGWRGYGPPRGDAAQAPCRDPLAGGLRRDERKGHARSARGGGARPRPRFRHDLDHQRLRRRAEAAAGRARGLDRRDASRRRRRISMASPRPRPRTSASFSIATRAWPRSCSGPRASFPRRTTIRRRARLTPTITPRRTNISSAGSRSRTSPTRISLAAERAPAIGFGRYIISATTPFRREDCARLRADAPAVVSLRVPGWEDEYARRGWRMFPSIDRVYDNALARRDLGWRPKWDFAAIVERLSETRRHPRAAGETDRRQRLPCRAVRRRALSGGGKPQVSEFAAWRRLDRAGRDAALLRPEGDGWLLQGAAAFDHERGPASVAYQVQVDASPRDHARGAKRIRGRRDCSARDPTRQSRLAPGRRPGPRPEASARSRLRLHPSDQRSATDANGASRRARGPIFRSRGSIWTAWR